MSKINEERLRKLKEIEALESDLDDTSAILDMTEYVAEPDDLAGLDNIAIYDYNKDELDTNEKATKVVNALVSLYLGDSEKLRNHEYIKLKQEEDAKTYADTLFLEKMARRMLLKQMKQIDTGEEGARMYEVINQTFKEIRETAKDSRLARTEIEKVYKEIRKDFSLNEVQSIDEDKVKEDEDGGKLINMKNIDEQIDKILREKNNN